MASNLVTNPLWSDFPVERSRALTAAQATPGAIVTTFRREFSLHKPYGSASGATCAASLCSLGAQQAVVIEHHEPQQSERERDGPQQA